MFKTALAFIGASLAGLFAFAFMFSLLSLPILAALKLLGLL